MRSHKPFVFSATMLASLTVAGLSFADPASTPQGATHIDTQTTMTPSSPSVPASQTTITTTGTATGATTSSTTVPATTAPATTTVPTSTTTTTAADTEAPSSPTYTPPTAESTTVYRGQRPNRPLLITGGALLVGTYATTAGITAGANTKEDHDLYLPVVGPWINLANRDCNGDCTATHNRNTVLIAGSGVLQGVGAAMVLTSFFVPEKIPTATIAAGPVKMQVIPTAGGMGAVGTF
jgi:hypothetical protein